MSKGLPVDLIFDIGKTNKKLLLFDDRYEVVHQTYTTFAEVGDDDGYLGEDLSALTAWIKDSIQQLAADEQYLIRGINISAYGASIVNIDTQGELATPFYNYTKPLPDDFYDHFFHRFGDRDHFALSIASPVSGMLNSGLQLFYLQQYKPKMASRIKYSLHFPQYLSSLITGKRVSDYTSLGCHTGLWDFQQMNYHRWVEQCGLAGQMAPIVRTNQQYYATIGNQRLKVGVGVHDSSAALLPYMPLSAEPFILLSTGTWSVSLNPFNSEPLTAHELANGCLCYMNPNGRRIKASRVFLGKEIEYQVDRLASHFGVDPELFRSLKFDPTLQVVRHHKMLRFRYRFIDPELFGYENSKEDDLERFPSFEQAYHHLMDELTDIQVASLRSCLGHTPIPRIYIDGGFSSNDHFTQLLANKLPEFQIMSSSLAIGSSLGAALLLKEEPAIGHQVPVECIEHAPT